MTFDSYQAIYDAVRSRISGGDVGQAVESAIREANLSHHAAMAADVVREAAAEQCRPSVLFRPALSIDGDQWCALYGDDLQCGVAGFGDSPAEAMLDFDRQWATRCSRSEPRSTTSRTSTGNTADGKVVPWLASQTDVLAEDWTVVSPEAGG